MSNFQFRLGCNKNRVTLTLYKDLGRVSISLSIAVGSFVISSTCKQTEISIHVYCIDVRPGGGGGDGEGGSE